MRRPSPLVGIFITVLLDLLNFGMFLPDLQLRVKALAALNLGIALDKADANTQIGILVGLVIAGFSFAQLVASPVLGGLSDRIGRRKILLATCALAVFGNSLYAFADLYWLAFLARVLAGLAAANLGVAFAYVADVTAPQERAASLGKLGAAFGIGFTLGPPLGGLLLRLGGGDQLLLGLVAAALALVNLLYVYFFLPESNTAADRPAQESFFRRVGTAITTPGLSLLLGMFFLYNFGFACLQSTFFLLLASPRSIFKLTGEGQASDAGSLILGMVGLFTALMQALVVPRAVRILGELKMLRLGLLLTVPGLALIPYAPLWGGVIFVVALQAVGNGLTSPSLNSLISRAAPPRIQGSIFGINQSLGSLARLLSPIVALPLFNLVDPHAPYLLAGVSAGIAALAAWAVKAPRPVAVPAT